MTVVTNPARTDSEDAPYHRNYDKLGNVGERSPTTSPPSHLFQTGSPGDIVFVAGINGDTWEYPAHRKSLLHISPILTALLSDENTEVIIIDYVDRRGFEQLLRYLYMRRPNLDCVTTTRFTLDAAYKFLCPKLVERCATRLDQLLDAGVALEILRDLRYLCARLPGAASAPTLSALADDRTAQLLARCSQWCDSLAHNALLVIDENADAALRDPRLEDLSYEDLALIVKRETLRVSSEMVLVEALSRWATAFCKRHKRELTSDNKRAALGELSYCPRYLLLEGEVLDRALDMELLQYIERMLVLARARKWSSPIPVGPEQEGMLKQWAQPRPSEPAALPVHLSARSKPPPVEEVQPSRFCFSRPKRLKQPSFSPEEKDGKSGCCACFGDGLLRAFICLFD